MFHICSRVQCDMCVGDVPALMTTQRNSQPSKVRGQNSFSIRKQSIFSQIPDAHVSLLQEGNAEREQFVSLNTLTCSLFSANAAASFGKLPGHG